MRKAPLISSFLVVAASLALAAPGAWAGCGCDHPAPCPAPVLPAFGSPGDMILLTGEGFSTERPNQVLFKTQKEKLEVEAVAVDAEHIKVLVPEGEKKEKKLVGPAEIKVTNPAGDKTKYSEDEFTYLGTPLVLREGDGHFVFKGVTLAVDTSGVLNVPLDVSGITAATAFAVYLDGLALEFGSDDILVYNKQGYNLNLFTMDIDGVEKQWGDWYPPSSLGSIKGGDSNVFTYWRHDFEAYNKAHAEGGEYYPLAMADDASLTLLHPDGTVHVDHGQLNVAVAGTVGGKVLPGGSYKVTLHVLQLQTENPDIFQTLSEREWKDLNKDKSKIKNK